MPKKVIRHACAVGFLMTSAMSAIGASASGMLTVDGPLKLAQAQTSESPKIFHGIGVVTAVDADTGALSVNHEEIPGLMDAMEMMYAVTPRSLSKGVHPGDKIEFGVDGRTYNILELKNIGPVK